ncbi:MAG TPA: hypothetical protein VGP62_14690 [Bryobacteraceae bacterium]|jgi:sirohydrochlorin ferrochelatase|nr:hypothetical protein [Bryobacteraceae bacterium]
MPEAVVILATDLELHAPAWKSAHAQACQVAASCAPILGFDPAINLAARGGLAETIDAAEDASEIFVLPCALEFGLLQREELGGVVAEARRRHSSLAIHHDDVDPGHPLIMESLADQAARALGETLPQHTGLILAASGQGDASSRAHSYRLMRMIWERLGFAAGEVGFLRHTQPFLLTAFEKCVTQPLNWVIVPQVQWMTEHMEYAQVILENFQRSHSEAHAWKMVAPPADHPSMTAWLTQRITRLWNEKRSRESARVPSPKLSVETKSESWNIGAGTVASVPDKHSMARLLEGILPAGKPERVLVKVTWHGYATGTYTDPAALDLLLSALPAKAIILEGHTSSRNLENAGFDWETEARSNRAWIRQQDAEYLRRTGLADVMVRHGAEYFNVTEAWWDEDCKTAEGYVPEALLAYRGCPLISFAKFKGSTRLSVSNLFGLIPEPLRAAWHGPNLTYMARVCCDIARAYGALFPLCGLNEALYSAVRWNRQGLYRSRWGNYDLISNTGYTAASSSLVTADILACRLQGQDVHRSAFFDVIRAELGWDERAATDALPQPVQRAFA